MTNLMVELRHYCLKQKLVNDAAAGERLREPSRSTSLDRVMDRVRWKTNEQERIRKESRKMVRAIIQTRKARKLKMENNNINTTHFRKKQVLEIKTRSQTVQIKKRVPNIKLSWREQRSRIHVDLIEHFR